MSKPRLSRAEVESIVRATGLRETIAIVGIRGYYLGADKTNNRGTYDDAIFIIGPKVFAAFRANVDPSVNRYGIASMKPGVHFYHKGKHKNKYWALRLVGDRVPVSRDGQKGEKIGIALNIHKGGVNTTGSEGCQTLPPSEWPEFIKTAYDLMDDYNLAKIPYILVEETDRRAGTLFPKPKAAAASASTSSTESAEDDVSTSSPAQPATQQAETIVNAGQNNTEKERIDAAQSQPTTEVDAETRTGILPKLMAFFGISSLTQIDWSNPQFSQIFHAIWEMRYLILTGLLIWFVFKKLEGLILKYKAIDSNTDPTKGNVLLVPVEAKGIVRSIRETIGI